MTNHARVVAVANQKGGVAKTTTAINLAASLAMANQRILLVDMDPQANLTSGLGLKGQTAPDGTIYDALTSTSADPAGAVMATSIDHLSIVPADPNLTGAEIELVTLPEREYRLRRVLDPLRARFDFIFIDTPPSLGLLTVNALVAADTVLVPLNGEYFALEGIAELLSTIARVRASLNPALALEGVLLTMYDDRTNLGQQVSANIREFFGDQVYRTVIPRNIRLGEAPSHGVPVILYDARSRGAEAYVNLAHEFLARTRGERPDAAPPATAERQSPPAATADAPVTATAAGAPVAPHDPSSIDRSPDADRDEPKPAPDGTTRTHTESHDG